MGQLQTYDREELSVVGAEYGQDVPIMPGQMVAHVDYRDSSCGITVACDEHHATVLWSRIPPEPVQSNFAKMAMPLARRVDYAGIARQVIQVEPMPQGALPVYFRKEDE